MSYVLFVKRNYLLHEPNNIDNQWLTPFYYVKSSFYALEGSCILTGHGDLSFQFDSHHIIAIDLPLMTFQHVMLICPFKSSCFVGLSLSL
jgi:hypothetical protein